MRKRTISKVADTVFWYALYFLPVILTLIQSFRIFDGMTFDNWEYIMNNSALTDYPFIRLLGDNLSALGFEPYSNPICEALMSIFTFEGGIFPSFTQEALYGIVGFFGWFISVYMCHLMVDFILFIPRLAHKWLKKGYQEGD